MSDYVTPCANPENDPEDWFIEKDGKQYADDELVSLQDAVDHLNKVDPHGTRYEELFYRVQDDLTEEAVREALIRRRKARDKCHVDCYARLQCLSVALSTPTPAGHGTWGGYYSEELRKIEKLRAEREKTRASQDVDVPGSE